MPTFLIPFLNRYSFFIFGKFLNFISRRIFRNFIFCRKSIHPGILFFSCDCVCLWNLFLFLSEMLLANYLHLGNGLIVFPFLPLLVILGIHLSLYHLNHLPYYLILFIISVVMLLVLYVLLYNIAFLFLRIFGVLSSGSTNCIYNPLRPANLLRFCTCSAALWIVFIFQTIQTI